MSSNSLPLILVSAADNATAKYMISELIDNEVKDDNMSKLNHVWRLENKYYTADVQLCQILDNEEPQFEGNIVDAHIIYLSENECDENTCTKRAKVVESVIRSSAVRLILAKCFDAPDSLAKCAQSLHYELVPLLETGPPPIPGEPFPELYAIPRARAALHAHVWRKPGSERCDISDGDSSAGEDFEDEDEEGAVERAEQFMRTLSLLPAAADLPLEERRDRAEALVAAFCRALGTDLDLDFDQEPSDR